MKLISPLRYYLFLFALLTLSALFLRTLFFFYYHINYVDESLPDIAFALIYGMRFDLAASGLLALVFTLPLLVTPTKKLPRMALILAMLAFITPAALQLGDMMYFEDSSRHIGYEIFDVTQDAGSLLVTGLSQHFALFVFGIVYLLVGAWGVNRLKMYFLPAIIWNRAMGWKLPLMLLATLLALRGGWQAVPMEPLHASHVGNQHLTNLALNGVYNTLYESLYLSKQVKPATLPAITNDVRDAALKELYPVFPAPSPSPELSHYNVVVILLESWPAVYMKSYGFDKATTPYFDSLRTKGMTTKGMLAGGHRTTEGMFTTFCSYQNPLGRSVAQSSLQNLTYRCLPEILTQQGYQSAFFQGSYKETSGTGSFARKLGFTASYGKEDIADRTLEENSWGVYDQDLYGFVTQKAETLPQPFILGINTNTTHDIMLPNGVDFIFGNENKLAKKLSVMHFADEALKGFIEPFWRKFPNTIFALVADHTAGVIGTAYENYLLPFVVLVPGTEPKFINIYASQRDIAPTILALLGDPKNHHAPYFTGRSILDSKSRRFADYYANGILGWIEGERGIELNTATGNMSCYAHADIHQPTLRTCDKEDSELKTRALAFTHYSQSLLFRGDTTQFLPLPQKANP